MIVDRVCFPSVPCVGQSGLGSLLYPFEVGLVLNRPTLGFLQIRQLVQGCTLGFALEPAEMKLANDSRPRKITPTRDKTQKF